MTQKNRRLVYSLIIFLLPMMGWTVEYQPWIGNYLEFEWRSALRYQYIHDLSSRSHLESYLSNDWFASTGLSFAAKPNFSLDVEGVAAWTRKQHGAIDQIRLNGRYVWLDDIAGDPVSLTTGASFIQSFSWSLKDISSFHHGRSEAELFFSVGKEWAKGEAWLSRLWAMGALGAAERGSPWLRFHIAYAARLCCHHEFEVFTRTLWGLGHKPLCRHHFHGYGPIQHQSMDIGFRYHYLIDFFGSLSIEYANRVYARNFPLATHQIQLSVLYLFGL